MTQVTDLKSGIDTQFRTALDLVAVARDLNAIRNRMEAEGQAEEAKRLLAAVNRLADLSDALIQSARASGRSLADVTRTGW